MILRIAMARIRPHLPLVVLVAAISVLAVGCRRGEEGKKPARRPLVVVGIDGGEWRVIERLWGQSRLPNLRALAQRGVKGELKTAYNSSPVIWTTIATGVTPQRHGITDFVVPTDRGDLPVSSGLRKVPALWNMTTRARLRTAVLGWWATWPAESIEGVLVSDRALLDLPNRVSPPEFLERFEAARRTSLSEPSRFRLDEESGRRDRAMAVMGRSLLAEDRDDLMLLYFRSTDTVSHRFWKYFEPEFFPPIDPEELAANRGRVPHVYEAVDDALGSLVAAAPDANFLVISDHGFHATAREEETKVLLDLDLVLERLGYLVRHDGVIDFAKTRCYSFASPNFRRARYLRFALAGREPGARVRPSETPDLKRRLAADLARVTYKGGEPAFFVRAPRLREAKKGVDLVVGVSPVGATDELMIGGAIYRGAVSGVDRISGTHTTTTHGILIAGGPDIQPGAPLEGIDVHDMAPTILFGLGLPVAEDFDGEPHVNLFTADFRRLHPLRKVKSWGVRAARGARSSKADDKLLDDLRSLGYIQ